MVWSANSSRNFFVVNDCVLARRGAYLSCTGGLQRVTVLVGLRASVLASSFCFSLFLFCLSWVSTAFLIRSMDG